MEHGSKTPLSPVQIRQGAGSTPAELQGCHRTHAVSLPAAALPALPSRLSRLLGAQVGLLAQG